MLIAIWIAGARSQDENTTLDAGAPGGKSRGGRPRAPRRNLGNQDLNCFDSFWSTWCTKRVVKRRAPDVNPAERESAQLVDFALRFDFVLHTASSAIYQSRGRKNTGSSQTLKDRGGGGALSRVAAVAVGPFGGRGARVPLRSREDKVGVRRIALGERARGPHRQQDLHHQNRGWRGGAFGELGIDRLV